MNEKRSGSAQEVSGKSDDFTSTVSSKVRLPEKIYFPQHLTNVKTEKRFQR